MHTNSRTCAPTPVSLMQTVLPWPTFLILNTQKPVVFLHAIKAKKKCTHFSNETVKSSVFTSPFVTLDILQILLNGPLFGCICRISELKPTLDFYYVLYTVC